MCRLDDEVVMYAAALGAENLEREEPDERTDRNTPGEPFEAVVRPGVLGKHDACGTAADNCHVVDEARERGNQELLARVLHGDKDAPHEDEYLARQDDAAVVRGTLDEFRRGALDGQELQEFLHPDERGNHEDQEHEAEGVEHVAEELPSALLVARDLVARENRDEDDGEEPGTHHMVEDIGNHEGEVERVLLERDARGVREEHFAENTEHAAQEHGDGNDDGSFVHKNFLPIRQP